MSSGTDLLEAARTVVDRMWTESPMSRSSERPETLEVVHISVGFDIGQDPEPGVCMTWTQGEQAFGLVMPISRLARQSGDLESVPFYLQLTVDEPHGRSPDGSRRWFLDLPSGVY